MHADRKRAWYREREREREGERERYRAREREGDRASERARARERDSEIERAREIEIERSRESERVRERERKRERERACEKPGARERGSGERARNFGAREHRLQTIETHLDEAEETEPEHVHFGEEDDRVEVLAEGAAQEQHRPDAHLLLPTRPYISP